MRTGQAEQMDDSIKERERLGAFQRFDIFAGEKMVGVTFDADTAFLIYTIFVDNGYVDMSIQQRI